MTTSFHNDSSRPLDYFTYIPTGPSLNHPAAHYGHHIYHHEHHEQHHNHFSTETPLCSPTLSLTDETPSDPYNPLLAYRTFEDTDSASSSPKMSSNLLQIQTNAAHSNSNQTTRPSARPRQNVLQVSGDGYSSGSSDGSSSEVRASSSEYARCSRCQRTPSIDVRTGEWNMVQYGLNLWYCSRCANLVGLPKR